MKVIKMKLIELIEKIWEKTSTIEKITFIAILSLILISLLSRISLANCLSNQTINLLNRTITIDNTTYNYTILLTELENLCLKTEMVQQMENDNFKTLNSTQYQLNQTIETTNQNLIAYKQEINKLTNDMILTINNQTTKIKEFGQTINNTFNETKILINDMKNEISEMKDKTIEPSIIIAGFLILALSIVGVYFVLRGS